MTPITLNDLGWRPDDAGPVPIPSGLRPARITQQGRGAWHGHDGSADLLLHARSASLTPTPVTGDWVLVSGDDPVLIEEVLPRRSELARAEAGGRSAAQVIAANVDLVGICAPIDSANPRRIERELTAVWSSGAMPIVIVTKADLVAEDGGVPADIAAVALGVDVIVLSSTTGAGLDRLRTVLGSGITLVLIGPSGVGKSTLVNALAGREVLATRETRSDGKGRHTTTSRHLVPLPGIGVLLDTPGMREFAPWADEQALAEAFTDIDDLARDCRFADCGHEHEPGCAVLAAADVDAHVAARLQSWRSLQRELAWLARRSDARLMAEERRRWAAIGKEGKARARMDPRRR